MSKILVAGAGHGGLVAAARLAGAGFAVDTNVLTLIGPDGATELPLLSKDDAADVLLDEILRRMK